MTYSLNSKNCLLRDARGGIATQNITLNETLEKTILIEFEERIIKNSLDIIVLKAIKNEQRSGYNLLALIYKRFGILLSAGTVYSLLYSLERKGLIKATFNQKARCYVLTKIGEETLRAILTMQDKLRALTLKIF